MLRILSSLALCLLLATPAAAQLASQTGLVGNVTDAGGGVLPGATVTAVNVGTQATLAGVTNEAGVYQFNAVPLGRYEITITLQGFQTFKATNIEVGGNQVVRQDAVLSVGALSETVIGGGRQHHAPDRPGRGVADRRGARRGRPAVERPQRVAAGGDHARRAAWQHHRHRPVLPRRRPARDPEQPDDGRHQRDRPTCWR